MDPDGDGIHRDAKAVGDLGMAQFFPGHKSQELLVVWVQTGERGHRCTRLVSELLTHLGLYAREADPQRHSTQPRPALVGEDTARDRIQPGKSVGRRVGDAPPRDAEGLRSGVFGVGFYRRPAQRIRKHPTVMRLE